MQRPLADETYVVYLSRLKALANDIERNLQAPLAGIRAQLRHHCSVELPHDAGDGRIDFPISSGFSTFPVLAFLEN